MKKSYRTNLMVCARTTCVSNRSYQIKGALIKEIEKQNLQNEIQVVTTGCNGFNAGGPLMAVHSGGTFYRYGLPASLLHHSLKARGES